MAAILSSFTLPKCLLGFRRSCLRTEIPTATLSRTSANGSFHARFRCEKVSRSGMKQRLSTVLASSTNSSGQDPLKDKAKENEAPQGPPFLTILAGLVTFLVILWIVGSIVTWLIGLIVNVTRLK